MSWGSHSVADDQTQTTVCNSPVAENCGRLLVTGRTKSFQYSGNHSVYVTAPAEVIVQLSFEQAQTPWGGHGASRSFHITQQYPRRKGHSSRGCVIQGRPEQARVKLG